MQFLRVLLVALLQISGGCGQMPGRPLRVEDFEFHGPSGSADAVIEAIETNRFRVTLGNAPGHTNWPNKLNFVISGHAQGNSLQLDVVFRGGEGYSFNEYFQSWSYDGENWQPLQWEKGKGKDRQFDTLVFPTFTKDRVYVGTQVPLSYQGIERMAMQWKRHPCVQVHTIGMSLENRPIYRIEVTDPDTTLPLRDRWGHWFAIKNTAFLCEGGGGLFTLQENLDSGVMLARALTEFYTGTRTGKP